eukprot:CAMPEP_0198519168 /NCGR_PEP_ID=MMETSP1462-20131121/19558_1 /TAXON_ID=1333877 /ORGANISM="Brandtodinium nutriculum, Strain RCC3387" /LENGTH=94 /DNA_ID=CAMNT_0044248771 /DNA_START=17 /DNA_END=297 /DNA_ORIENTATION=-
MARVISDARAERVRPQVNNEWKLWALHRKMAPDACTSNGKRTAKQADIDLPTAPHGNLRRCFASNAGRPEVKGHASSCACLLRRMGFKAEWEKR